ncbi:MAG: hypothetical protein HY020_06910 [Burkholderiales bacterium]|nr:hypothetical protein [Burkholderiales bacterium]
MKSDMVAILARKRAELDELERSTTTPGYQRLLQEIQELFSGDVEPWLADWLMRPSLGLGAVPLVIAAQPNGVEELIDQLQRVVSGTTR